MRHTLFLALSAISLAACTAPTGGESTDATPDREYTRDEARAAAGKTDHGFDICDWMGWYGDDICDEFCPEPDPDCAGSCRSDLDCPQPLCLPGGPCPSSVCVDGECVIDDTTDSCPAGQRECVTCGGGHVCAPHAVSCPLVTCPPPPRCGGIAGLTCPAGMFCDYEDSSCGYADQLGTCAPIPDAWIEIYAPVCGCDGNTYGNEGEAHGAGTDVAHEGACAEPPSSGCVVGGCSGQVCYDEADGPIFTTCEWRPEYACYDSATCERQPDGNCGWTPTPELSMCLAGAGG